MQPSVRNSQTLQPLVSQFNGHLGIRTMGDGSLIVKPAFPAELEFYQTLLQAPDLSPLRPFIPKFFGTRPLGTPLDGGQSAKWCGMNVPKGRTQSLILENLSHHFLKPNTLDIKLGTVFYDEGTSPEKVVRMEKTSRETTSFETGIRLTEFQVYDNITSEAISTPKTYGKAMKRTELPDGFVRFFPVGCQPPELGSSTHGLPRRTLRLMLRAIHDNIVKIREAYSLIEMRMVGASMLIIYEADWSRAEEGLRRMQGTRGENGNGGDVKSWRPPYVVKLVDFAHTRLATGGGPDEGVLRGMDTMLRLLEGRIAQLGTEECL